MEQAILDLLDRRGNVHIREISDALDEHPVTVDQHCFSLHQDAYIRSLGTGVYQLTRDGERRLDETTADPDDSPIPDPD